MSESLPYDGDSPDRAITLDANGKMGYSGAADSGFVPITIPSLPGSPRETETLLMRDFGQHVIGKIESRMAMQGYMTSGALQDPPGILAHYLAVAKGGQLLDAGTLSRGEKLSKEFAAEGDRKEYFEMVVKPWLGSLSPKRRA
ncbi:MAG: hypothetical protein WAN12_02855 [Candidatus Acidiferrum sp.]